MMLINNLPLPPDTIKKITRVLVVVLRQEADTEKWSRETPQQEAVRNS